MALTAEDFETIRLSLVRQAAVSSQVSIGFAQKLLHTFVSIQNRPSNDPTLLADYLHAALASDRFTRSEIAMLHEALAYFSL